MGVYVFSQLSHFLVAKTKYSGSSVAKWQIRETSNFSSIVDLSVL